MYVLFCSLSESKDTACREQVEGHDKLIGPKGPACEGFEETVNAGVKKETILLLVARKPLATKDKDASGTSLIWCELKENNFPPRQKSMTVTVSCEDTEKN